MQVRRYYGHLKSNGPPNHVIRPFENLTSVQKVKCSIFRCSVFIWLLYMGRQIFFFQLNLLPPYSLGSQGDNNHCSACSTCESGSLFILQVACTLDLVALRKSSRSTSTSWEPWQEVPQIASTGKDFW